MKIMALITFGSFLFISYSTNAMESKTPPSSSYFSTIANAVGSTTFTIGLLFFDILNFNSQEHSTIKKRRSLIKTHVSDTLSIIAPVEIEIKNDGHYLRINGEYYDSTLKGKLVWKNGEVTNKKGLVIDPLL